MLGYGAIGVVVVILAIVAGLFALIGSFAGAAVALSLAFVLVSLLLMLVILIQRPKGGGLSGAFGGVGGNSQAAFGAKTGDVLTYATVVFFVLFLGLIIALGQVMRPAVGASASAAVQPPVETVTPEAPGETLSPEAPAPVIPEAPDTPRLPADSDSEEAPDAPVLAPSTPPSQAEPEPASEPAQ